ncbi:ATP-grasp domain-containing protein [Nocardia iowensis]|uniref:ATP-grasp domain-containing protein n=1 Tax=Nocardia iowensis TaxID=204891 RepID=A0ABX8S2F4_NOCIO|nr:ATP-grasp domain-containing protein [Nocardia iowensis]QXN94740.1 ATP-grasp domain-containing protein [Nocardia iowensis]
MHRRVLVTGVGGQPGFDLAHRLMELGCDVIATDADPLASGLLLPGVTPCLTKPVTSTSYGPELMSLCRELRPGAIVSAVESELPQLLELRDDLEQIGVRAWAQSQPTIEACLDKAIFYRVLTKHGVPTPVSWLPEEIDSIPEECPLVVKPRRGQGSKDVVFCRTPAQARIVCEVVPEPIVQARIQGREFTADCLVDRAGRASAILRYRLLTKGGLSMVGETFHDLQVHDRVTEALAAVEATGLCCVQGFVRDGPGERVLITEINARIAGGFRLAEAAGADLVGQALAGLWGHPIQHERLSYRAGVRLTKCVTTLDICEAQPGETSAVPACHGRNKR